MFTASNVASTAASAGSVGPVVTAVVPTFQKSSASVAGSSSSSSSSSITSSTQASATWRFTSLPSTIIKQPSIVSIINGNINTTTSTSVPLNTNGITIPSNGNMICITTANAHQYRPISTSNNTGNIIIQSTPTVRLIPTPLHTSSSAPTFTLVNNSNLTINGNLRENTMPTVSSSHSDEVKHGVCIQKFDLGQLAPSALQKQIITQPLTQPPQISTSESASNPIKQEQMFSPDSVVVSSNDSLMNNSQEPEIEIFVNNVVSSFSLGCPLNLRRIALNGMNVVFKRDQAMLLMKIRNPYCSANIWSSGKVTVTGATSEDDAKVGARRIARAIQRLGFKVRFLHYRVVNCLATCSMPWPIDIVKLSRTYPQCVSYEPEIHPGATVRLPDKAVLKVFTTGNITLTAPSVDRINAAVNEFYPQLFECRKINRDER